MSFDIYGNPLRHGHCEVHPSVHEEYPCSVCLAEKRQRVSQVPQCDICGLYDAVADSHGFAVCSQECCDEATCRATTKKSSDAEIARLTRELEEARADLKLAAGTTIEDALLVPRAALSRLRRERDEARQALEAERARVAELEKLIDEEAEHDTLCGARRLRRDPCNCWKSKALAAKGGER